MNEIGSLAWWGFIVGVAWAAAGVLEWVKGFFRKEDGTNRVPSWTWRLILAAVSAGAGIAMAGLRGSPGLWASILNGGAVLAAGQIGYPVLVQIPEAVIKNLKAKLGGAP